MKQTDSTTENLLRTLPEPLLGWYRENARDLPWRHTEDPYRIWVSEIMLQQTRVAAVLGYYARFMEEMPTVERLAAVDEERLMKLWEESGVARGISKLLKPLCRKLFKTEDEEALSAIGMNLSANLLGIGGAATPYGIRAATLLDKSKNARYSSSMLFVINATSLQLIPTSVVAFRIAAGSASAADIILPTMLATAFSSVLGVLLVKLFIPAGKRKEKKKSLAATRLKKAKTQGAGQRP